MDIGHGKKLFLRIIFIFLFENENSRKIET